MSHDQRIPKSVVAAVYRRADNCCEDCGSRNNLTLHHITYVQNGSEMLPIHGYETTADLDLLCWPCHQARHRDMNGDYWKDPDEMTAYWWTYYSELDSA